MTYPAIGSAHHAPRVAFSTSPTSTAVASNPSMNVTRPSVWRTGLPKCVARTRLACRESEHHHRRDRSPRDSQQRVLRVETGDEYPRALHGQIDRKNDEGPADDAKGTALPLLSGTRQLPDDHRASADLDQRIEAEPTECYRASRDGGDYQHDDADDVAAERDRFQLVAVTEQPASSLWRQGRRWEGRHSTSGIAGAESGGVRSCGRRQSRDNASRPSGVPGQWPRTASTPERLMTPRSTKLMMMASSA